MAIISSKPSDTESAKVRNETEQVRRVAEKIPKKSGNVRSLEVDLEESSVRPHQLAGYVGQTALVQSLSLAIAALQPTVRSCASV